MAAIVVTASHTEDDGDLIRQLQELIVAIDRRLPQVERAGEITIANAAMRLRIEAQRRIAELQPQRESQAPPMPGPKV